MIRLEQWLANRVQAESPREAPVDVAESPRSAPFDVVRNTFVGGREDEGRRDGGQSTAPEVSRSSSLPASPPALGVPSPVSANVPGVPNFEGPVPSEQAVPEADMHAGACTSVAMLGQQSQHVPANPLTYQPEGPLPLFFDAHAVPFAFERQHEQPSVVMGESSPFVDSKTVESRVLSAVYVIWCDHRAFKETSGAWKEQLERTCGTIVKTYKTAENCIRLFRKKAEVRGRPPCVVLVSCANAVALLAYLKSTPSVSAKVVVLCDAGVRRSDEDTDQLVAQFPSIDKIAATWEEAVEAATNAVAAFRDVHVTHFVF